MGEKDHSNLTEIKQNKHPEYMNSSYKAIKKPNNLNRKLKDLNRHFTEEEIRMAKIHENHMKLYSVPFMMREIW